MNHSLVLSYIKKSFLLSLYFLFLFVVIFSSRTLAQNKVIDSLKTVLRDFNSQKSATIGDTSHVKLLSELSEQLLKAGHFAEARKYADEAIALSKTINDKKGEASVWNIMATISMEQNNFPRVLKEYQESLKIWIEIGDKPNIARSRNNTGIYYRILGNLPEALGEHIAALKIFEELGDKKGIAFSRHNIGIVYKNQGNYEDALEEYTAALKIRKEIGDEHGIADSYNNIGNIYYEQGRYSEALNYHFASLKIKKEKIRNKFGIGSSHTNIGNIYYRQGKYTDALRESFAALKMYEETDAKTGIASAYIDIGNTYTRQKKFKEASEFLNKALPLSKETGILGRIRDSYSALSALDSAQGNFKAGWEHLQMYYKYRDSILNTEKSQRIKQLQMQYDFDKKESAAKTEQAQKDALAKQELERQKLIRNGTLAGLSVVIVFAFIFFFQRNRISKAKKRSDELLLNILPGEVAEELKAKGSADAKQFDSVTVMFTDFKGFTQISEKLSPTELVSEIHSCFKAFDNIITKHNIEKIKTIGDSYMCAGGLPVANKTNASDVVKAALEIQEFMQQHLQQRKSENKEQFEIRIGVHTGPVVAGIVGVKKFAYDIWGDTVNIASRMESSGEAGKVNISGSTYQLVKDKFNCIHRGKIQAKNKGEIDMYFVEQPN